MSEEEKKAAVKDFALTKGLLVALLAGVMSACFNLGLESGTPILEAAKAGGANELFALNPVILLVTLGGFVTNAAYCIFQNIKNKTGGDYLRTDVLAVVFSVLRAGHGQELLLGFSAYARFLMEHTDVAQRDIQQFLGYSPQRMERCGQKNGVGARGRNVHSGVVAPFA